MHPNYPMLLRAVGSFAGKRVCIVGDLMLDRYVIGDVERISPEAPVPVLHVRRELCLPGGAANVAANVAALGGIARLVGFVGQDAGADHLRDRCAQAGIGTRFVTGARPTIEKTRFVCQGQQLLRADREEVTQVPPEETAAMLIALREEIGRADVILLSDYAKGAVSATVTEELRACGKPVIVDPKPVHLALYEGLFLMTPNHREAAAMAQTNPAEHPPREALTRLHGRTTRNLLVTCGAKGMVLLLEDGSEHVLPSKARAVFDVTGAGDTVLATLGLGVAAGLSLPDAANLANHAAGLVVAKSGTETVSPDELKADLSARMEPDHGA